MSSATGTEGKRHAERSKHAVDTYLMAIEVEGKTPRTIESYEESLRDFRRVGRALGLPDTLEDLRGVHTSTSSSAP